MQERRRSPRALYRCSVILWRGPSSVRLNAYTRNVSEDGACIILDEEILIGEEIRLQIDLGDGLPPIVCPARVIWTLAYREENYPIESTTRYRTGFRFISVPETDRARLRKVIAQRV